MDKLAERWKQAKEGIEKPTLSAEQLVVIAKEKKRSILYFHYGNIAVLTITLIAISLFFYYVTPFKELLSKTGVSFMVCGLLLRIMIEIFSAIKSRQIKLDNLSVSATNKAIDFYRFRKKIHGPVTITIVALYVIGFYFLSPEFSRYITLKWMIIMDGSFVVGAVFLIWQIRKGIQKELRNLSELLEIKNELDNS